MTGKMKCLIITVSVVLVLCLVAWAVLSHPAFGRKPNAQRQQRIESSPNYRNGKFCNRVPTPQFTGSRSSASKVMWGMLRGGQDAATPTEPLTCVKTDLRALPADRDWLVWFGHSSYLFQLNGKRFLVDPLLKMEFPAVLMLKPFKGTDIYRPDDIPDIDYLIITHEHWDHLDYATLRELRSKVRHAVCPLGVAEYLEYWNYDPRIITEMDWDQVRCQDENGITITCLPTRHFSNRLFSSNQTLWASFMVEANQPAADAPASNSRKVYVGGDGGYDNRFRQIYESFGQVDLAMMENGQYNANWANIHLMPNDLEKAILDLKAKQVFTVHHDKFKLSLHAWNEPDSVAHDIARRDGILLLDAPIGTVVYF